jgi:hypothetical protein
LIALCVASEGKLFDGLWATALDAIMNISAERPLIFRMFMTASSFNMYIKYKFHNLGMK